jgi:hypothetical protein
MIRSTYLESATVVANLLRAPEVATSWSEPSALRDFGVSGLAGHLARSVTQVHRIVQDPPADGEPIPVLDHFTRNPWVATEHDDPLHIAIRKRGEDTAADGPAALADAVDVSRAWLERQLPDEPADRVVELTGMWCLTLDDFLLTRLVELVVHTDDLAVSVGTPTPALPEEATDLLVDLLARLAVWRHGPLPVLRALTRQERAPATIAAF